MLLRSKHCLIVYLFGLYPIEDLHIYIYLYLYVSRSISKKRFPLCQLVFVLMYARLPWWLRCKASSCSAGDLDLIPGSGISPEKEMATHSSTLAEKFCGLQFMGSQRVGHE